MQHTKFLETLRVLAGHDVKFIVVGGLAGGLNGAPINTLDVDIVHSRDPANVQRTLRALESIDAIFRVQPDRRLKPEESHLSGAGHLNLVTRLGYLDVLGAIGRGLGYAELLPHSVEMQVGGGISVHVLGLETLIELKEDLGRDKDRAVLAVLKRTLEEKRKH